MATQQQQQQQQQSKVVLKQSCVVVGADDKEPIINAARFVFTAAHGGDYLNNVRDLENAQAKEAEEYAKEVSRLPLDSRLVAKLLENADKVFSNAKADDVETVFIIAATVAERLEKVEQRKAYEMISEAAKSSTTQKVEYRSRILMQLYNLASDLELKFLLFCKILEYVKNANMDNLVETLVQHVEESMDEWKQMNNNDGSERNVYLEISNLLKVIDGQEEKSIDFTLKYLAAFENAPDSIGESAEAAKSAIASYIRLQTNASCDLLDYKAIQALKSGKDAKVYELLEIFLTRDVADYLSFMKGNGAVLKDLGLNEDETLTKMRLVTLGGIRSGGDEVSYKEICEKLQIDMNDCEEWVVRGISSGLVGAKLDQVREVCMITRSTQRVFGKQQWSELKNSLSNWSENLQSMKTLLQSDDISTISAL
jgi:translation initiation factor 3 subunit M